MSFSDIARRAQVNAFYGRDTTSFPPAANDVPFNPLARQPGAFAPCWTSRKQRVWLEDEVLWTGRITCVDPDDINSPNIRRCVPLMVCAAGIAQWWVTA
ncbi:MAG TPA: hypothetical protein VFZ34_27645 [Blastocatellia bacterium]|nr:hypothetical protein [Blastocatellia bacterium]